MSIFKRVFIGMIRRPFKSLLLVLFTFSLGTFVGSSYLISKATNQVQKTIESKLDSYAKIETTEKYEYVDLVTDEMRDQIQNQIYDIHQDLKNDETVIMSNINSTYLIGCEFVADLKHSNIFHFQEISKGAIDLMGIDYDSMINEQKIMSITEGRSITKEDIENHNKVIVINELYKYTDGSEVNVGDKVRITYRYYLSDVIADELIYKILNRIDYEFEVIGKYRADSSNFNLFDLSGVYATMLPETVVQDMKEEIIQSNLTLTGKENNPFEYNNIIYKLDSPDHLEEFKNKFMELIGDNHQFVELKTSSDGYYEIKGTLDNMKEISNLIFFISGFSSVFIGILVIYLYLKDRTNEVGILLSMGEKRVKIFIQIMCEVLLLGLLGLSSSLYSSNIVGHKISSYVLNTQLEKPSKGTWNSTNAYNEIKNNYEIEIDDSFTYLLIGGGSIVLCISSCLPLIKLMKSTTKDVLL